MPEPTQAATIARLEPAPLTQPDVAATRTKVVGVRLTEAEYASLVAIAAERHMTPSQVLRLSWFLIERLENTHV